MSTSCLVEKKERSTFDLDVAVTDEYKVAVTPTVCTYTLMNRDEEVINELEDEDVTPAEIMRITLAGADLKIENSSSDREYRILRVKSDRGTTDEPENIEYPFWVKNLGIGNV